MMPGRGTHADIFDRNLPYRISEEELRSAFEPYGEVSSVRVVIDRETGKSKGFGFVEMPTQSEAEEAVKKMDGHMLNGRNIRVNEARPRTSAPFQKRRPA